MADCMDKDTLCVLYETCPQVRVWDRIQLSIIKILEDTTLEDMLKERKTVTLNRVN